MDTDNTGASADSKKGFVEWGGFASALRQDCGESTNIGPKSADLLTRLDELAACKSMPEIGVFANSDRSFAEPERDYLNSRLLDEIYASLSLTPLPAASRGAAQASSSTTMQAAVRAQSIAPDPEAVPLPKAPFDVASAMPFACAMGYAAALAFFGERGAALHSAIDVGVMHALSSGMSYLWNANLVTLLQLSAAFGRGGCVRYLLEARDNGVPIDNRTLWFAIRGGHAEVVQLLIDAGADVHADGDDCFQAACDRNHIAIVWLLLTTAFKTSRPFDLRQPLLRAVQRSQEALVECLLHAGADIHADEELAIKACILKDNVSMLRLLIAHGANFRLNDDEPLVIAAGRGYAPIIELLIESGANVHARGEMPLIAAALSDHSVAMQSLLTYGADPTAIVTARPAMGVEPLRALLQRNRSRCLPVLLDGGLPVAAVLPFVLDVADHAKRVKLLDLVAERSADPIAIASARLVIAAKAGNGRKVEALLQAGARPERFSNAALHHAMQACCKHWRNCVSTSVDRLRNCRSTTLGEMERRVNTVFDKYHNTVMLLLPRLGSAQGVQTATIARLQLFLQTVPPHLVRVYLQALGTVVASLDLNFILQRRLAWQLYFRDATDAVATLLEYGADASSVSQELLNECKAKGRMALWRMLTDRPQAGDAESAADVYTSTKRSRDQLDADDAFASAASSGKQEVDIEDAPRGRKSNRFVVGAASAALSSSAMTPSVPLSSSSAHSQPSYAASSAAEPPPEALAHAQSISPTTRRKRTRSTSQPQADAPVQADTDTANNAGKRARRR